MSFNKVFVKTGMSKITLKKLKKLPQYNLIKEYLEVCIKLKKIN